MRTHVTEQVYHLLGFIFRPKTDKLSGLDSASGRCFANSVIVLPYLTSPAHMRLYVDLQNQKTTQENTTHTYYIPPSPTTEINKMQQ